MDPGRVFSVRTLAKKWNVYRSTAQFKVNNEGWTKVHPHEVGSMKASVNVWRKD